MALVLALALPAAARATTGIGAHGPGWVSVLSIRRRLTPGRYRIEVAAGTTRTTLGAVSARTTRVVR